MAESKKLTNAYKAEQLRVLAGFGVILTEGQLSQLNEITTKVALDNRIRGLISNKLNAVEDEDCKKGDKAQGVRPCYH